MRHVYAGCAMNESSMRGCRYDEWSELLLLVMKTSLSVAHELGLLPEAVLDAASHLRFHDFACFASAIQGASRAHACCARRDTIPAVEVAYIKTFAARLDSNRNVLACVPTMCASDLENHVGASDQTYEKVAAGVQALKEDVQREFSLGNGAFGNTPVEGASGFAQALAAIMPADDNAEAFERALAAVLHVRFTTQRNLFHGDADCAGSHQGGDGPSVPGGWMQRINDAVHHPIRLHN